MAHSVTFESRNGDSIFPRLWGIVLCISKTKNLGILLLRFKEMKRA